MHEALPVLIKSKSMIIKPITSWSDLKSDLPMRFTIVMAKPDFE